MRGIFKESETILAEIATQVEPGDCLIGHGSDLIHCEEQSRRQLQGHAKMAARRARKAKGRDAIVVDEVTLQMEEYSNPSDDGPRVDLFWAKLEHCHEMRAKLIFSKSLFDRSSPSAKQH